MELLIIILSLCICPSLLVKPCAAASRSSQEIFVVQEQSNKELGTSEEGMFPHSTLPRKLRILQEPLKDYGVQGSSFSSNEQTKPDASSKPYKRQQNAMTGEGTKERADKSEYLMMDYPPYKRRRRPIHNKSLPAGP